MVLMGPSADPDLLHATSRLAAAEHTKTHRRGDPVPPLTVLGRWYLVPDTDRKTIATAAVEGWPPTRMTQETRDAVVTIGAGKWLQR